jgi:hypothetical protein
MGSFDVRCALSGLPLEGVTILLLTDGEGHAVAQPLAGAYDTYGGIELTARNLTTDALWKLEKTSSHPAKPNLEALSQMLTVNSFIGEAWSRRGGRTAALAANLLVEDVFRAAIATTLNAEPELRRSLAQSPISTLYERAFRAPEISNTLYAGLQPAQLETLRASLIDLVAFQPWEAQLRDDDGSGDQYDTDESVEEALSDARARFAASPLVVAAVEVVAARWRRRG